MGVVSACVSFWLWTILLILSLVGLNYIMDVDQDGFYQLLDLPPGHRVTTSEVTIAFEKCRDDFEKQALRCEDRDHCLQVRLDTIRLAEAYFVLSNTKSKDRYDVGELDYYSLLFLREEEEVAREQEAASQSLPPDSDHVHQAYRERRDILTSVKNDLEDSESARFAGDIERLEARLGLVREAHERLSAAETRVALRHLPLSRAGAEFVTSPHLIVTDNPLSFILPIGMLLAVCLYVQREDFFSAHRVVIGPPQEGEEAARNAIELSEFISESDEEDEEPEVREGQSSACLSSRAAQPSSPPSAQAPSSIDAGLRRRTR